MGVVELNGESGIGRWPCLETGTFSAVGSTPARGYDNRAMYQDRYIKIDDRWYFAHRRYLYLWLSNDPLPGAPVKLGDEIAAE